MKILTIGAAMLDMFMHYKNQQIFHVHEHEHEQRFIILEEGSKTEVESLKYNTGGGATNSAISFRKQGFSVTSFFKIGADTQGAYLISQLKKQKINLTHIVQSKTVHTGVSCIIPTPSGDRTILAYRGANLTITPREIPRAAIAACDQLYITSLSAQTSHLLPLITALAKKNKKSIAINPGTSQLTTRVDTLIKSLSAIDILILNCKEVTLLMNSIKPIHTKKSIQPIHKKLPNLLATPPSLQCVNLIADASDDLTALHSTSLIDYFSTIHALGPKIIVVTNGADGVYASNEEKIYYHPSIPTKPINTVGAGDAFGSAFVGSLCRGFSLENSLRAGIVNSASVLGYISTTQGLLSAYQIAQRIKKLDQKLLQIFPL